MEARTGMLQLRLATLENKAAEMARTLGLTAENLSEQLKRLGATQGTNASVVLNKIEAVASAIKIFQSGRNADMESRTDALQTRLLALESGAAAVAGCSP